MPNLKIERPASLSLDQRVVFERLSARLRGPSADRLYDAIPGTKSGSIISVDLARWIAPEFQTWDGRLRHTPSTGSPAGAYAHDRLLRELRRNRDGPRRLTITAGGAGSGKTTLLSKQGSLGEAELIFDNQFRSFDRAARILRSAVKARWEVYVFYVHRPFEDVVRAVLDRSQRTGRWNPLAELPGMHLEAQRTILKLRSAFHAVPGLTFRAQFNASQGVKGPSPGDRVYFRDLRAGGPYHLGDVQSLLRSIPKVLETAVQDGIVCPELAQLVGEGLPQVHRRQR